MWSPAGLALRAAAIVALLGFPRPAHAEQEVMGEAKETLRQQLIAASRAADRLHQELRFEAYKLGVLAKTVQLEVWREGDAIGAVATVETVAGTDTDPEPRATTGWFGDGEVFVIERSEAEPVAMAGPRRMEPMCRPYREGSHLIESLCGLPSAASAKPAASCMTGAFPRGDDISMLWHLEITTKEPRMFGSEFWDTAVVLLQPTPAAVVVRGAGVEALFRVSDGALLSWRAETTASRKRVTIDSVPPTRTVEAWRELVRTKCAGRAVPPLADDVVAEWRHYMRAILVRPIALAPARVLVSDDARAKAARILVEAEIAAADRSDLLLGDATGALTAARDALEHSVREACAHASWPPADADALAGHVTRDWGPALERAYAALWSHAPNESDAPVK